MNSVTVSGEEFSEEDLAAPVAPEAPEAEAEDEELDQ